MSRTHGQSIECPVCGTVRASTARAVNQGPPPGTRYSAMNEVREVERRPQRLVWWIGNDTGMVRGKLLLTVPQRHQFRYIYRFLFQSDCLSLR